MSAIPYTDTVRPVDPMAPDRDQLIRARKNLTYLVLFAIVMAFSGLLSAYLVSKGSVEYWVSLRIPEAFYWSTAFILLSSVTVQLALVVTRQGRSRLVAPLLVATLALGLAFSFSQVKGWAQLTERGNVLSFSKVLQSTGVYGQDYTIARKGITLDLVDGAFYLPTDAEHRKPLNDEMADQSNAASQYVYVLTALHLAHLVFGLLALIFMAVRAGLGHYTAQNNVGLWAGTLYWHFLGGLWVILLSFLLLVH